MEESVYIGLGSNLGNRRSYISSALSALKNCPENDHFRSSSLYETEPEGVSGHPDYLNAVAEVQTGFSPESLKDWLESVEQKLGRTGKGENNPRVIDLDLLFYGRRVMKTDELILPHPEAHCRYFVLKPMMELCPDFEHPTEEQTIEELMNFYLEREL